MEDTLRAAKAAFEGKQATVLILVLMEDTLREPTFTVVITAYFIVLILVLMEDTLRVLKNIATKVTAVLILVLMEDTLREERKPGLRSLISKVLILVLMEDTLRAFSIIPVSEEMIRLNPCFNGRYSQRQREQRNTCTPYLS